MSIDGHHFPSCPICSRNNVTLLMKHGNFKDVKIYFCAACQHWFSHPTPDVLYLEHYYKNSYSKHRSQFFDARYYVLMEKRAQAQISFLENCLQKAGMNESYQQWHIADFGCGIGALVSTLQRRGVNNVIGYDSDPEAVKFGHKRWSANISVGTLDDLIQLRGQFDLLILSHIIEHLPDMKQALRQLFQTVKPGGWIFIEVPNCFHEIFSDDMDTESHLHFFSRQSLTLLLNDLGASVLSCEYCGPPYSQRQPKKVSVIHRLALRLLHFIELPSKRLIQHIQGNTGKNRTLYDGFYDHYPPDHNGLWLRCLARIPNAPLPEL